MPKIAVFGAGKIGSLVTLLLSQVRQYKVTLIDLDFKGSDQARLDQALPKLKKVSLDINDPNAMDAFLQTHPQDAVISCLPFHCSMALAVFAKQHSLHYFDLTEDIQVTQSIKALAEGATTAFVPQCGLAPGFIGIVANSLMHDFDHLDVVKLRVGALPINSSNPLHYALTWSTDGLINQYGNPCQGIENGDITALKPLEGLESIKIDGVSYEAFNTSGGLGSLATLYEGKVRRLNYKSIRYPGHCEKISLLMNGLQLNSDRGTLKHILENAIPKTYQDVVIVYVAVTGWKDEIFVEESYVNKIYPQEIQKLDWSAIQISTAAGVCAVVDLVHHSKDYQGFVLQEAFTLEQILSTPFGKFYKEGQYHYVR